MGIFQLQRWLHEADLVVKEPRELETLFDDKKNILLIDGNSWGVKLATSIAGSIFAPPRV